MCEVLDVSLFHQIIMSSLYYSVVDVHVTSKSDGSVYASGLHGLYSKLTFSWRLPAYPTLTRMFEFTVWVLKH